MPTIAMESGSRPRRVVAGESTTAAAAFVKPLTVIILSGGTGRTGEAVVASALAQFREPQVQVVRRAGVRTISAATQIVQRAAEEGAVIVQTLVAPKIRAAVKRETERRKVPTVDILGPVLNALTDHLHLPPRNKPGLSYELQKESFDRIDAVDFTLKHDDGACLHDLAKADVVLVGASRVSKSVTCFYLAYRGIRAANVPLIRGHEPPSELLKLDPKKVVGLTMNAQRLQNLRTERSRHLGAGPLDHYTGRQSIVEELRYASDVIAKHHWPVIDISYMAVEEVAIEVTKIAGLV